MSYGDAKDLQGTLETAWDWNLCVWSLFKMLLLSAGVEAASRCHTCFLHHRFSPLFTAAMVVGIQHAYVHFNITFGHESKYLLGY